MYHREYPITPTQQATNGALNIFIAGYRHENAREMLIGLSVLSSATETQVNAAIQSVQANHGATVAEISAMLAA
jgi:hypothetical protein